MNNRAASYYNYTAAIGQELQSPILDARSRYNTDQMGKRAR